jgi:hypothetical protein
MYQDYFRIIIEDESGYRTTVFDKAIDDFAVQYTLIPVSPDIVFDQEDVYMTGWQTFTYNISAFAGESVTLIIEAGDVGDSIYDSAILLDMIEID